MFLKGIDFPFLLLADDWKKESSGVNSRLLKPKGKKLVDCDTGNEIPLQDGVFTAKVSGRNFRLFLLELE